MGKKKENRRGNKQMNPILPLEHFIPDAEARQWADGRMYLYGSCDKADKMEYCSHEYHVFSSDDLIHWVDHGVSFRSDGANSDVPWSNAALYAPDCIFKNGIYYLYFCLSYNGEGVATSKKPEGPFRNAVPVVGANGDAIDPAVFLDDDGQAYLYWGQFHARGARLDHNMSAIGKDTFYPALLTEAGAGFHEGASVRKRNGIYYLVYTDISRGKATCISYATSLSPLGPYTKGGVIIDNDGCDPETWNNHGSIAEFNGDWYVFYHRSSRGSHFSRRVCMEPIRFDSEGRIREVPMTTQGISGPIPSTQEMQAARACQFSGNVRITGVDDPAADDSREMLSGISSGDWAVYRYLDFKAVRGTLFVDASCEGTGGMVEFRLDKPLGPVVARCPVTDTGSHEVWRAFSCEFQAIEGAHAVYLHFIGGEGTDLFRIRGFRFVG